VVGFYTTYTHAHVYSSIENANDVENNNTYQQLGIYTLDCIVSDETIARCTKSNHADVWWISAGHSR